MASKVGVKPTRHAPIITESLDSVGWCHLEVGSGDERERAREARRRAAGQAVIECIEGVWALVRWTALHGRRLWHRHGGIVASVVH